MEIVNNSPNSSQISLINDEQSDLTSSCIDELQSQTMDMDLDDNTHNTTAEITILQITTTKRGGSCLMENNFVYTKHRKSILLNLDCCACVCLFVCLSVRFV